jgi:hypothetical protein
VPSPEEIGLEEGLLELQEEDDDDMEEFEQFQELKA